MQCNVVMSSTKITELEIDGMSCRPYTVWTARDQSSPIFTARLLDPLQGILNRFTVELGCCGQEDVSNPPSMCTSQMREAPCLNLDHPWYDWYIGYLFCKALYSSDWFNS